AVSLPADDLESLLQGPPIPPEGAEAFKAQIAELPVRLLKAGEEITLADGRKYKARAEDVTPDRAVALPQGASFPALARKVDGRWRIDAAPIIASMKGAGAGGAPKTPDPAQIKDKVTIKLGQKIDIQFTQKDGAISAPNVIEKPPAGVPTVHAEFLRQDDNLMLMTQNPFSKNMAFRALARHKGRKAYVETSIVPVGAGISGLELWRDPIEELVLFDFKLVGEKP
ncbi:MAG TPA: hypothetical protein VGH33_03440, partial [Isosphaeraceae bacterium]